MKRKEINIINSFFSKLRGYLSWILENYYSSGISLRLLSPLLEHLEHVFKTRGLSAGIAYVKAVRGNLLNYLSGSSERFPGVRVTKEGIPVCLGPVIKELRKSHSPVLLRFVLTVLFATRALKTRPIPDLSAISDPLEKGASLPARKFETEFWRQLGYQHQNRVPRPLRFNRFHFTTKAGPNGHALNTWLVDLISMPEQHMKSLVVLGGRKLAEFFEVALKKLEFLGKFWPTEVQGLRPKSLSRLAYFSDREGKTRVIALGDYFSQTVLKGLHAYLFRVLRKIPQDCTFDQSKFQELLKDGEVFYSVDLTSATDRFPIAFISSVLRGHLPFSYVQAWEKIMVDRDFLVQLPDHQFKDVRYAVGNPMGFYSSWSSFALAHHYVIYYLCRIHNRDWTKLRYALLGDDIVIADKEIGDAYLGFIRTLGVRYSVAKTHVSTSLFEFAKRWTYKGEEITPFPISALHHAGKKSYLLTPVLIDTVKKGWIPTEGISVVVREFYGRVLHLPSRLRKKFEEQSYIIERIIYIIQKTQPAGEMMNQIARRLGYSLPNIHDYSANNIIANVMVEKFADSNAKLSSPGGKPLGLLAETLVMYITGVAEEDPEVMPLLENPLLHAYGSVEQSYLDLLRMAKHIDTVGGGDWPFFLRAMTIPLSDELFVNRQADVEAVAISKVAHSIREKMEILKMYPNLLVFTPPNLEK